MALPPPLRICLLGDFSAVYDDAPIASLSMSRLQQVLAYLVLHRHVPQSREHLAFLFWPDSSEARARTNLRGVLYRLKRALPPSAGYLRLTPSVAQWVATDTTPFSLDVAEFEAELAAAERASNESRPASARAALERAVALYRGDLLRTCYQDWVAPERERLRHAYVSALEKLISMHAVNRHYSKAIEVAAKLVEYDSLREDSYRSLMRLHMVNDDRTSAMRVYVSCTEMLRQEFELEPSPATEELHQQLLRINAAPIVLTSLEAPKSESRQTLVGREQEWSVLQTAWRASLHGQPFCALMLGEAGIGKTRLAEEMIEWVRRQGISHAIARCYASGDSVAYVPMVDWLRSPMAQASLAAFDRASLREIKRLLPEAAQGMTLPDPESLPQPQQRQRLFDALARVILRAPQPILLCLDDAQWCDQETFDWLRYLLHWPQPAGLLLLITARAEELEEAHPLRVLMQDLHRTGQASEISLGPLGTAETAELAAQLAGRALTSQQVNTLYQETEGNPLFVVEVMQTALGDDGALRDDALAARRPLSRTVQAAIARRLARLSPSARELMGLAATIGREFTALVLRLASNRDEEPLARDLDELWRCHIVRELHAGSATAAGSYDFTHDKIRQAAYEGLSPARRRWLHLQVAQVLESLDGPSGAGDADTMSAQVAAQYTQAGMPERAIPHLLRTAELARSAFANDAALRHCQRALDMLSTLPATPEHARLELDVLLVRMAPLIASHGYAATEVGRAKLRAWELGQRIARPNELIELTGGLWNYYAVKSDWSRAQEYGESYLTLAKGSGDPIWILEAHRCLDETLLFTGAFTTARTYPHWERITYDARLHSLSLDGVSVAAKDPIPLLAFCARVLWSTGHFVLALERAGQMLAMAEDQGEPYPIAFALSTATQIGLLSGTGQACRAYVDRLLEIASKRGFSFMLAGGTFFRGWLWANLDGRIDEGIAQMRDGLAQWRRTGAGLWQTYMLGMLAESQLRAGQITDGLAVVSEALVMIQATGERFWEAELRRLQGELTQASVSPREATATVIGESEQCLQDALSVARRQGSRPLELRAVTSLARLLYVKGEINTASVLLGQVYDALDEGFNTADMAEARALLEQIRRGVGALPIKLPQQSCNGRGQERLQR